MTRAKAHDRASTPHKRPDSDALESQQQMLTPSEIESLRQGDKQASAKIKAILASRKAAPESTTD